MDNVMLTVICLCYNHEKYIAQTLENFVSQKTNFKIQVIVHDDASKDNSQSIIKEYAEKYPDVIDAVLQKENQYSILPQGMPTRTYINPLIKGKYIAYCEGDDYWCDKNKLQKQVDFLESHPEYSLCVHNSYFQNTKTEQKELFNKDLKQDTDIEFDYIVDGLMNKFHLSSWVYKKELHLSMPDFCTSIKGVGDYPKALFLACEGKVRYMSDIMSVYRYMSTATSWTSQNNKINNFTDKKLFIDKRVKMLSMVKEVYPEKTEFIDKAIKRKRFELIKITGNYKDLKNDAFYKELYSNLSFLDKLKFLIRHFSQGKNS